MPNGLLKLTREELFELVWSKPVTELAQDFGMSDVALAKRCRTLRVPIPGRGYWARVAAGQAPRRPRLPDKPDLTYRHTQALIFPTPPPESAEPAMAVPPIDDPRRAAIDALHLSPLDDFNAAHAVVKRLAVHQKALWRKDIIWKRGEKRGPTVQVDVSDAQLPRALKVLDALLRGVDAMAWHFEAPPPPKQELRRYGTPYGTKVSSPPDYGHLVVDGEHFMVRIGERRRRSDHVLTHAEKELIRQKKYVYPPRWDFVYSGELWLQLTDPGSTYPLHTWKDGKKTPLEHQAAKVLHGLLDCAIKKVATHAEDVRIAAAFEERKRREAIERRLREANQELVTQLERQAGAWQRARQLRRYLRAARRALGDRPLMVEILGEPTDLLAWAEAYVDQMDPLHPRPRATEFATERRYTAEIQDHTLGELRRLLGADWAESRKLVICSTKLPGAESDGGMALRLHQFRAQAIRPSSL